MRRLLIFAVAFVWFRPTNSAAIIPFDVLPRDVGNLICYRRVHSDGNQINAAVGLAICERDVRFCGKILRSKSADAEVADGNAEMEEAKLTCYEAKEYCTKDGIVENEFYVLECCSTNFCN
ncbi:hypothetical protein M3Y99_01429800 [Aphelenchoides fujianensis]|nr:hypothetical protein M3Y99_01429800 [Aphelenchoides fujianensis]